MTTPAWHRSSQLLIERTEGNPFFLEESVRTLVETGVLVGERGAYRLAQALPTDPGASHGAGGAGGAYRPAAAEEKHLLQTAAVIGTEVPLPLLQAIAEVPEETPTPQPGASTGGRVPVRDAPLSGARVHLQARPHP